MWRKVVTPEYIKQKIHPNLDSMIAHVLKTRQVQTQAREALYLFLEPDISALMETYDGEPNVLARIQQRLSEKGKAKLLSSSEMIEQIYAKSCNIALQLEEVLSLKGQSLKTFEMMQENIKIQNIAERIQKELVGQTFYFNGYSTSARMSTDGLSYKITLDEQEQRKPGSYQIESVDITYAGNDKKNREKILLEIHVCNHPFHEEPKVSIKDGWSERSITTAPSSLNPTTIRYSIKTADPEQYWVQTIPWGDVVIEKSKQIKEANRQLLEKYANDVFQYRNRDRGRLLQTWTWTIFDFIDKNTQLMKYTAPFDVSEFERFVEWEHIRGRYGDDYRRFSTEPRTPPSHTLFRDDIKGVWSYENLKTLSILLTKHFIKEWFPSEKNFFMLEYLKTWESRFIFHFLKGNGHFPSQEAVLNTQKQIDEYLCLFSDPSCFEKQLFVFKEALW